MTRIAYLPDDALQTLRRQTQTEYDAFRARGLKLAEDFAGGANDAFAGFIGGGAAFHVQATD